MRGRIEPKRAIAASAIVAGLVLSVPCADMLMRYVGVSEPERPPTIGGIDSRMLTSGIDASEVINRIDSLVLDCTGALPDSFQNEIGCPEGAHDVRVSGTGKVVGFLECGEERAVMDEVSSAMREKGWTEVPLGSVTGATFAKKGGACSWALVTCTQVGDETSVVFRGDFR